MPNGDFLNALITFAIIAAVVFFAVIKPVNALSDRHSGHSRVSWSTFGSGRRRASIPLAARRCAFCTAEVGPAAA